MIERIVDGRTDLIFEYLADGHPASAEDANGVPLIRWCAYYGDVSAIRFMLERGASLAMLGTNLDLNGAVFHGHWQLTQFLIDEGADVNYPLPETGETPLHVALSHPNRPAFDLIVRILLAAGADPNAATIPEAESGCFMREARTKGETPLHRAAAFGSMKAIDLLLEAGADIEARDANGETPLGWASWHQRPDSIIRRLCYGPFSIHPDRDSEADHGQGWSAMDEYLRGNPHV